MAVRGLSIFLNVSLCCLGYMLSVLNFQLILAVRFIKNFISHYFKVGQVMNGS